MDVSWTSFVLCVFLEGIEIYLSLTNEDWIYDVRMDVHISRKRWEGEGNLLKDTTQSEDNSGQKTSRSGIDHGEEGKKT